MEIHLVAVTQLASVSTVTSLDQNGYGVGNLTSVTVKSDGSVVGFMITVKI